MRLTICRVAIICVFAFGTSSALANDDDIHTRFHAAQKLLNSGETEKAFVQFAAIPGAQHVAVGLGRENPRNFSRLLADHAKRIPLPLRRTVEGDLLLRAGFTDPALAAFREVAAHIATGEESWADGYVPADAYLAEPTDATYASYGTQRVEPFSVAPGSHRDNWLIRRFIVLKAWDDAEREFERVWRIHESNTRPFFVEVPQLSGQPSSVENIRRIVKPAGFSGQGLQFALDYAFFLLRRDQQKQSFALLQKVLGQLDLDRDPNRNEPQPLTDEDAGKGYDVRPLHFSARGRGDFGSNGVSRREFIRLTFGAFKQAGLEQQLIDELKRLSQSGRQQALRILAQVRRHQGLADAALKLELDYITRRKFDELSAAWRRGRAYEAANQPEQAAKQYVLALAAPFTAPDLPDKQEETTSHLYASAMISAFAVSSQHFSKRDSHVQLQQSLSRLYSGLGKSRAAFDATLRAAELDHSALQSASQLLRLEQRARLLDCHDLFVNWLLNQLKQTTNHAIHAEVHWLLKDHVNCAKAAARFREGHQRFKARFASAGQQLRQMFLNEIVSAQPTNSRARLELLDISDEFTPQKAIPVFEQLVDPAVSVDLAYSKTKLSRRTFWNYYDVTYRLMRLYESVGRINDLCEMGLKIARDYTAAKTDVEKRRQLLRRSSTGELPDYFNDCMALLIQHAQRKTLEELRELWKDSSIPAQRQLDRRLAGKLPRVMSNSDVPWANAPAGVRLIVSHDNVHSMTIDDQYVYTGHPWGVVVRQFDGQPLMQIAIGQTVHALAAANGWIWVGTTRGLYRVERGTWQVSHKWLHDDVPASKRYAKSFPSPTDYWFDNKVYSLTLDADDLWITLHRNVQRLHIPTMTLRAFSYRELKSTGWTGYTQVVPDGDYVWVSGRSPLLRYNRKRDLWEKVGSSKQRLRLIGIVGGEVLVEAYLEKERRRNRPAIVNRHTLEVTLIPVTDRHYLESDGTLSHFGLTSKGHVLVGCRRPELAIDLKTRTARGGQELAAQRNSLTRSFAAENTQWSTDGNTVRSQWKTVIRSPRGGSLIAHKFRRSPNRFDPQAAERPVTPVAGLRWDRGRRGTFAVSQHPCANTTWGGIVFDVVNDPDHHRKWLCTDFGLTVLNENDQVAGSFTRADGLVGNRVTSGLSQNGKLYFAAATSSHDGGLIEFDSKTNVWTTRFESDGLETRKIARLESWGDHIRLVYAGESNTGNGHAYRLCPPGIFEPATGRVTSTGNPKGYGSSNWPKHLATLGDSAPILGGHVLAKHTFNDKSYLATSNGLLILDAKTELPSTADRELLVTLIVDPAELQIAAAKAAKFTIRTPADVAQLLKSNNPYVRARVYATTWQRSIRATAATINKADFIPALTVAVHDPHLRARSTGLFVLSTLADASTIPTWKVALKDDDHRIRALATMTLARLGSPPELSHFQVLLTDKVSNLPFDLESSVSAGADRRNVYAALATIGTPEVFQLLMKYPPYESSEFSTTVFQPLGVALRSHTDQIGSLLKANDPRYTNPSDRSYVQRLLAAAGPAVLTHLHQALRDKDRVVRSNAARACGAIGEASSIPHLTKALDLESGLSRASIVWALGELKAASAMPKLVSMYIDAKNDERNAQGGGFRASQATAVYQSHYESIQDLQSLSRDWDKMQRTIAREAVNPRENEELLTPRTVLEAVRKIGPRSAQDFYRRLAAESDMSARLEASEQLAHAVDDDVAKNTPILRSLLVDRYAEVRVRSAASLLILGDTKVHRMVLEWLKSPNIQVRRKMLLQLMRVTDGAKLRFAREAVRSFPLDSNPIIRSTEIQTRDALLQRMG